MNKYKVKNTVTGEEIICEKVVVGDNDYYLNKCLPILENDYFHWRHGVIERATKEQSVFIISQFDRENYSKVIATTNPSLDLPKVIDEVETITEELCTKKGLVNNTVDLNAYASGLIDGYNKAKETYSYTKDDMVDFADKVRAMVMNGYLGNDYIMTDEEMFDIWQEQRTKTILVK